MMSSTILILLFLQLRFVMECYGEKRTITVEGWGSIEERTVEKYTLKNKCGMEVDVITYGATITSIRVPDREGNIGDIVLGFDDIEGYRAPNNPYFGATIGRVANRIGKGEFVLDGRKYHLTKSAGENTLHGGVNGWNGKIWNAAVQNDRLVMSLLSEDGDEGFPGAVIVSVSFTLTDSGELVIEMTAFTAKPTPINLTNHSYFNLGGEGTNATELYKHRIMLNADRWTVTDSESIPTGEIRSVEKTVMDLRNWTILDDVIGSVPGGGYDMNFCLPKECSPSERNLVAKVFHPPSGRFLEVYSNQPGVQFYTSNFLPEPTTGMGIRGKSGKEYFKHGAFCLETQNYPDAVNHKNFPNSIIRPSDFYRHSVVYKFGTKSL